MNMNISADTRRAAAVPGLVTVIMPAYNAQPYIAEAIRSVIDQTHARWELLVVDDGSTDGTPLEVASVRDARVRLLQTQHCGESAARNVALDASVGEFIAFLDADDFYLPQHLERTVAYLRAHTDRDGVYTDGYYFENGRRTRALASRRLGALDGWLLDDVVRSSAVFGPPLCVVLRVAAIARGELRFDPNIVIGPDWDFLTRVAERTRFGCVDECTCVYRVHATSISVRTDARRRAAELAKCRMNAIQRAAFAQCSPDTREFAFYDLLTNLLAGCPDRQSEALELPQFQALTRAQRGRLLRLMASKALLTNGGGDYIADWLHRSCRLNPSDGRARLLHALYSVSPRLCRCVIEARTYRERRRTGLAPLLT